jgi:hypothetical protein
MLACLISRKPAVNKEITNIVKYPMKTLAYPMKVAIEASFNLPAANKPSNALALNSVRKASEVICSLPRLASGSRAGGMARNGDQRLTAARSPSETDMPNGAQNECDLVHITQIKIKRDLAGGPALRQESMCTALPPTPPAPLVGEPQPSLSGPRCGAASAVLGYNHLVAGEPQQAIDVLCPVVDELAQFPFPQWEGLFAAKLAEAWLCLGDVVQAQKAAQRAVTVAEACGFMFGAAWARRALARVAFAEGKFAAGGEDLARVRNTFCGIGASLELADARSSVLSAA